MSSASFYTHCHKFILTFLVSVKTLGLPHELEIKFHELKHWLRFVMTDPLLATVS